MDKIDRARLDDAIVARVDAAAASNLSDAAVAEILGDCVAYADLIELAHRMSEMLDLPRVALVFGPPPVVSERLAV